MDSWVNKEQSTTVVTDGNYLIDYENSRTILGAEDNYTDSWKVNNNYKGYFYEFKIYNNDISNDNDITNLVILDGNGCPNDWANCQAC